MVSSILHFVLRWNFITFASRMFDTFRWQQLFCVRNSNLTLQHYRSAIVQFEFNKGLREKNRFIFLEDGRQNGMQFSFI